MNIFEQILYRGRTPGEVAKHRLRPRKPRPESVVDECGGRVFAFKAIAFFIPLLVIGGLGYVIIRLDFSHFTLPRIVLIISFSLFAIPLYLASKSENKVKEQLEAQSGVKYLSARQGYKIRFRHKSLIITTVATWCIFIYFISGAIYFGIRYYNDSLFQHWQLFIRFYFSVLVLFGVVLLIEWLLSKKLNLTWRELRA